jgi:hypothetical protein
MHDGLRDRVLDLVAELLYYGRKEDEDLPRGVIEAMINRGYTSADEIVAVFAEELKRRLTS